jgi:hypothetical protein
MIIIDDLDKGLYSLDDLMKIEKTASIVFDNGYLKMAGNGYFHNRTISENEKVLKSRLRLQA